MAKTTARLAAVVLISVVLPTLVGGCGALNNLTGGGDPGESAAEGPHRVIDDGGQAHWVALDQAWTLPEVEQEPKQHGIASDGERAFIVRRKIDKNDRQDGELIAYQGESGEELWRKPIPWLRGTSPVAADGTLVIATGSVNTESGIDQPAKYVAFDTATGDELWQVKVSDRSIPSDIKYARFPTPGAFLDGLFYYSDGAMTYGVDAETGKRRVKKASKNYDIIAGPIVAGDRLVMIAEPKLMNTEVPDQHIAVIMNKRLKPVELISFPEDAELEGLVTGEGALVIMGWKRLWVLDGKSGEAIWDMKFPDMAKVSAPVAGVLPLREYKETEKSYEHLAVGYDLATGKQLWSTNPGEGGDNRYGKQGYTVRALDGTLFTLGHGIAILDPATGKVIHRQSTNRGGGAAVKAGNHIIVYNHDGITAFS